MSKQSIAVIDQDQDETMGTNVPYDWSNKSERLHTKGERANSKNIRTARKNRHNFS